MLSACGGLPKEDRLRAEQMQSQIIQPLKSHIDGSVAKYQRFTQSDEYADYTVYAERENWSGAIADALRLSKEADAKYLEVQALLKKNDEEDATALRLKMQSVEKSLADAKAAARKPMDRVAFLKEVRETAPERVAAAKKNLRSIEQIVLDMDADAKAAIAKHPNQVKKIEQMNAQFPAKQKLASDRLTQVEAQLSLLLKKEFADLAVIGDGTAKISELNDSAKKDAATMREKLAQLDRSYSVILQDMKVRCFVSIGRTSWDDYDDWPTEHNYTYPTREVSEDVFEEVDDAPDTIATYRRGFGGENTQVHMDNVAWNALSINSTESWPTRADDEAEFWVADGTECKYYHRYTEVNGHNVTEGDWKEVDWEDFEENLDNLGMTIQSKPYGAFEDETMYAAVPAGMEYVGNEQYGEWKEDSEGNSFWEFYGKYAFMRSMFMPAHGGYHYYYYSEWDDWNSNYRRNGRGYYGSGTRTYGSYGSTGTRYSTSSSWNKSGGLNGYRDTAKDARVNRGKGGAGARGSVRGAGSASRGRGPGGGGK